MIENYDIRLPRWMDAELNEIGRLYPANVQYVLNKDPLSTATITLNAEDAQPNVGQFVELYDVGGSIGVFRVEGKTSTFSNGGTVKISLEHALTTLSDGVVFGYQEFGGAGVNLRNVITTLLQMQPKQMWVLGDCEFETYFQYSFENDNLLTAIISLAEPLEDEYLWEFDTDAYPFILHLRHAPTADASEMRMNRNIHSVKIEIDKTELCTQIYPLGYGEGVNQLTIADANNGIKYLNADTQDVWGVVRTVYAETSVTDAATLKAMAETVLEKTKNPKITVTIDGAEIYEATGEPLDKFYVGRMCRVPLPDYGITIDERVLTIQKSDVYNDNQRCKLTLSNRMSDSVETLAIISRKSAINELYSQGSTCMYSQQYADNASAEYPASMRFYIPAECVHINQVELTWSFAAFRAYETGAAAGGASTSTSSASGESTQTSSAGGATTVTTEQQSFNTTGYAGTPLTQFGRDPMQFTGLPSNDDGTSLKNSTDSGGSHSHNVLAHNHSFSDSYSLSWGHRHTVSQTGLNNGVTGGVDDYGAKTISISGMTGSSTTTASTAGSHTHGMNHRHDFVHVHDVSFLITIPEIEVNIPSHRHTVNIPAHTHGVTIGDHTHPIQYGIYTGSSASGYTLKVDGTAVPSTAIVANRVDVTPYLAKTEAGKITRSTWHEVEIVPDGLTRVEMNLFVRTFVRSISGGNF